MINITLLPIIPQNDNYAYILEGKDGSIAVVDPGEAAPFIEALETRKQKPDIILITHHHWDHTDGINDMLAWHDCPVAGPEKERGKIPQITIPLNDGDTFTFGGEELHIIETPGHTAGHICYYAPESKALFSGDTLFAMGCGRLFEGTPEQMHESLQKLCDLPDDTKVYCGHEYTLTNARFSAEASPQNKAVKKRLAETEALRSKNIPTIPTSIGKEKETNFFLRALSAETFAALRQARNNF